MEFVLKIKTTERVLKATVYSLQLAVAERVARGSTCPGRHSQRGMPNGLYDKNDIYYITICVSGEGSHKVPCPGRQLRSLRH